MSDQISEDSFTAIVSKYLNKFINDLAENKEAVLEKVDDYPRGNKQYLRQAITDGPQSLPMDNVEICRDVFGFIEWYSTGRVSDNIEIEYAGEENAKA